MPQYDIVDDVNKIFSMGCSDISLLKETICDYIRTSNLVEKSKTKQFYEKSLFELSEWFSCKSIRYFKKGKNKKGHCYKQKSLMLQELIDKN